MLNFLRNIGFTKQDILLFFFLLGVFVAGIIVRYTGIHNDVHFDYSSKDLQFEQSIQSSFEEFKNNELSVEEKVKLNKLSILKDSLENSNDKHIDLPLIPGTKLNINEAYSSELVQLPGVGDVTADRIVSYREKNGRFKDISEIMNVKGIGVKKFEKLKDYITVK